MSSSPQSSHGGSRQRGRIIMVVLLAIIVALVAWGLVQRGFHKHEVHQETEDASIPRVALITPEPGPSTRQVDLPANLAAWYEAPIYAQVSGYVKMWYKDYGAKVKRGDVLAEISTPSLDAQFNAAKAHYDVVMARYRLALITTKRWTALRGTQAVSRQEVDVQAANAAAQKAELEAASYDVERYQALENFKKIIAPFDGIVTSRLVNVGDYVNPGGGNVRARGSIAELFSVADVHRMRVFVSVPQDFASVISPKITADLTVPQYPNRNFKATFLATARAFNAATRTVTTELVLDNDEELLWPNSYATAHIKAPGDPAILIVPTNALLFRAQGMQLAKVVNNHVHLQNVQVGINYGLTSQVLSGIDVNDQIIASPTADLLEGDEVHVVPQTRGYNDTGKPAHPQPVIKNVTSGDLRKAAAVDPEPENAQPDAAKSSPDAQSTPEKAPPHEGGH
ncbi:efflux RND transporter periplasmic adaptor subunit [Saccharibacter floricola]|uniref:Multidrug efflux pump acriflavin resistance protein AcrB/AcrD/AcrF n=1 Tax=Saccharibacter floricola DSM 15669 TaxID=1123227 RepID=A0ABQ0NXC8_9PROT|nr:efflux RND transporter periplasmic adaptor subunit [Saccharibacter floricola]GBQ05740.1 multidrug efflux pump acriflavin resistance protein AcrB/AcrD/AcrF [Saccharibacter floricola DSM 15669]